MPNAVPHAMARPRRARGLAIAICSLQVGHCRREALVRLGEFCLVAEIAVSVDFPGGGDDALHGGGRQPHAAARAACWRATRARARPSWYPWPATRPRPGCRHASASRSVRSGCRVRREARAASSEARLRSAPRREPEASAQFRPRTDRFRGRVAVRSRSVDPGRRQLWPPAEQGLVQVPVLAQRDAQAMLQRSRPADAPPAQPESPESSAAWSWPALLSRPVRAAAPSRAR